MTNGEELKNKDLYKLYVLWQDENPIYVGVTTNIDNRIRSHRTNKTFNSFSVIEIFKNKKEAYAAERCIIKFMSVCGIEESFINATTSREIIVFKHRIFKRR